ncbi:MAG: hypothetical protein U1G07_27470, partial [Verrucomicrobiota bacterium]
MRREFGAVIFSIAVTLTGLSLHAALVPVPNASFESPATGFVSVPVDAWQKSPKPSWYEEGGGFLWSQLIGAFKNTAPTSPDHIANMEGSQAVW